MARRTPQVNTTPLPPPARTVDGRNEQLIAAAFDLAEQRLRDGTASAQETVHFLKMGTTNAKLEQEKLRKESLVLDARVAEMQSRQSGEEKYAAALNAFRGYSGQIDPFSGEEYTDEDLY